MSAPNDERKVEIAALQQVAAMFQTPSQLEKLDVLMKRADRKKVFIKIIFKENLRLRLKQCFEQVYNLN